MKSGINHRSWFPQFFHGHDGDINQVSEENNCGRKHPKKQEQEAAPSAKRGLRKSGHRNLSIR